MSDQSKKPHSPRTIEIVAGPNGSGKTTLSGRTWLAILQDAIDQGYRVTIYYLYLNSVKKNLQRIKKRVQLGGHPIPTEAVHQKAFGSLSLIPQSKKRPTKLKKR